MLDARCQNEIDEGGFVGKSRIPRLDEPSRILIGLDFLVTELRNHVDNGFELHWVNIVNMNVWQWRKLTIAGQSC